MTREHRENLAKLAKQLSNKAKDSLRKVRSGAVTQAKRAKEGHSEDTVRLVEKQVGGVLASSSSTPCHLFSGSGSFELLPIFLFVFFCRLVLFFF